MFPSPSVLHIALSPFRIFYLIVSMCWILDDLFKSVVQSTNSVSSLSLTYLTCQVFNYGYIFFISKSVVWFFFKLPWSFGIVPLLPLFLFFEHIKCSCTYFAFCIWWFLYFSPFFVNLNLQLVVCCFVWNKFMVTCFLMWSVNFHCEFTFLWTLFSEIFGMFCVLGFLGFFPSTSILFLMAL